MAVGRALLCSAILFCFPAIFHCYYASVNKESLWKTQGVYRLPFMLVTLRWRPFSRTLSRWFAVPRRMTFLSGRISHYPNSEASFNLTRIAVSGDVSVNPVPAATGNASVKCPIRWKTVANPYRAVSCDTCLCWVHIKCGKITQR